MHSLFAVILLTVHMMLALALIGVVLLQRSEGGMGGLGGGGMSGFMTTRGTANLLTRTTRWLAGAFMATSMVLAYIAVNEDHARPVVSSGPPVEAPAPPGPEQSGSAAPGSAAPENTTSGTGSATAPAPATTPATGATPSAPAVPTNQ